MTLEELIRRYRRLDDYFDEKFPQLKNEYRILARLGKITEELGELNSAVHGKLGLHRQEKQKQYSSQEIATEWADLFNTVLLFGIVMDIDMPEALEKRLEEVFQRLGIDETD